MRLDTARPSNGFRPAQCSFGRRISPGTIFVRARIPSRTIFVRARLRPPFAARKAGSKPKNDVTRCFLNPRDARAAPAAIPQGSPSREAGSILNITYSPFPRKPLIREDITPKVNLRPVTKSRLPGGGGSLAFPSGFEPLTFRLGVDSEPPNCSKIGNFLANRALLCVFFVYFAMFFMFQASIFISFSNFYAKIYAKTMLF